MEQYKEIKCDLLIVGTEGAGARAAIAAQEEGVNVIAVTKGLVARSGATLTSDGETDLDSRSAVEMFGVKGSMEDSPEIFAKDIIMGGDFLSNQKLAAIQAEEAAPRVKELVDWGGKIEGFHLGPGHTYPRGLWISGPKFTRLLAKQMGKRGVPVMENTMILELLKDKNGINGAIGIYIPTQEIVIFRCKAVILATGGAMRMFPLTSAPEEMTGDGMAMALRAGAELQDMEFPMFLPYVMVSPPALNGVIFTYDVSALVEAHALNRHGQRYMAKWDPERMEMSTRDINSIASAIEILEGRGSKNNGTYLSVRHLPRNLLDFSSTWFPDNLKNWKTSGGMNLKKMVPELIYDGYEVSHGSHFWNGGIKMNEHGETNVRGLYAAGEGTACVNGANRICGNAMTQTQVWGKRAGEHAARFTKTISTFRDIDQAQLTPIEESINGMLNEKSSAASVFEIRRSIRRISIEQIGVVRTEEAMRKALVEIANLKEEAKNQHVQTKTKIYNQELVEGLQNLKVLDLMESVVLASMERKESRGAMYRLDYPETDDENCLNNIILKKGDNGIEITKVPVKEEFFTLPKGKRNYGTERTL